MGSDGYAGVVKRNSLQSASPVFVRAGKAPYPLLPFSSQIQSVCFEFVKDEQQDSAGTGNRPKPLKKSLKSDSKKTHVLKKASIRIITWLIAGNSDDIRAIIF